MENILTWDFASIGLILAAIYPPLLFLLPASTAAKISLGVKAVKTIADSLENLEKSKGGLTTEKETSTVPSVDTEEKQTFYQKSK